MTAVPVDDHQDFADADRGFIAPLDPPQVIAADGRVVWDAEAYSFLAGNCPGTANESLWRQGRLVSRQGLYEVTEGIYQVRGLDLSNMTLVEGERGVIVIDPLVSAETAAAALELYRKHRGDRPVSGLIYTRSHADHFGGGRGVLPHGHNAVPVLAPAGFLEHAVSENVYAGTAMARRAVYMYGAELPKGPAGQIGCGLGATNSTGTLTLIPPTVDITSTGQEEIVDGVRLVFQLTPGPDAPAEMNFYFPAQQALCTAESATHTMHNILALRGAAVRDTRIWSHCLSEALALFGEEVEVAFASHHWPTWGKDRIRTLLANQRDLYAYLHDQTLRLLNEGLTGNEIAEELRLPPGLERVWASHGYYGSLSHNVKAIYQRYMGWFDGNPAHLWEHPPVEQAKRYVAALGGIDATVAAGRRFADSGDLRFAATLLNHAVFADPGHVGARHELAAVYDRLGQGCENGTWRNFYLTGAMELRGAPAPVRADAAGPEIAAALTVDQLIDSLAIRVDGPRAWASSLTMDWYLADEDRTWRLTLSNGALTYRSTAGAPTASGTSEGRPDLTVTLTKPELLGIVAGRVPAGVTEEGEAGALNALLGLLTSPDPDFPIVTP
ncbi:MBL fold metallo-hydrolase [Streptomyces piniterrae]|uniref:MBL fold metallo-hydrolase n=1 Tax=Streptomyces piniterrae TaxID=2571125 RepID=A0A4U0NW17_9ACTN|nr:alkyl sulfatase dimerization domain-containing protein [Streptomyces piniterrae]TJZ58893.1 MBL fold metallo-hydrolase [Streptomyces piniterrae]